MKHQTRQYPQFNLRMPAEFKDWIKSEADKNARSINSEILIRLEASRKFQEQQETHQ